MNLTLYLVLDGWLCGMGIITYLVWNRMRQATLKRHKMNALNALTPPLPGQNHVSLPPRHYQLQPALPPHPTNQPEKFAAYQQQQAKWQQWQQLKRQPLPTA